MQHGFSLHSKSKIKLNISSRYMNLEWKIPPRHQVFTILSISYWSKVKLKMKRKRKLSRDFMYWMILLRLAGPPTPHGSRHQNTGAPYPGTWYPKTAINKPDNVGTQDTRGRQGIGIWIHQNYYYLLPFPARFSNRNASPAWFTIWNSPIRLGFGIRSNPAQHK